MKITADVKILKCEYDRHCRYADFATEELQVLEEITNRPNTSWEQETRIKAATARFLAEMYAEQLEDLKQEMATQKNLVMALALDAPKKMTCDLYLKRKIDRFPRLPVVKGEQEIQ